MKKLLGAIATLTVAAVAATAAFGFSACGKSNSLKIIDIPLSSEQYGIAIQKGNTTLKTQIDAIIEDLTGDGVEYNGKTVTFLSLYEAEKEAEDNDTPISIGTVKKESTDRATELVVATNAEFAPFEYMVGDSFGGIDMQIAKMLADKLEKTLVIKHMDFEMVTDSVKAGNADIALAGLTINEDRLENVDFSVPYYDTTQYIAVQSGNTDFDNCKTSDDVVNVLKGYANGTKAGAAIAQTGYFYLTGNEAFEFEGFANLDVKSYSSIAMAVQDLANGTLKLVCGDKDTLTSAVKAIG